jgi:molecular chaperone DnaK
MVRPVGIDLGSSTSVVCAIENGRPVIVPNGEGSTSTPSVVAFAANGDVLVGEPARRQAITNSERTLRPVWRGSGTAWRAEIDGRVLTTRQVSAFLLGKLVRDASSYLGEEITDAVVAVPAHFGLAQRQAVREAGQVAGLNVRRVIGATEAAALAYHAARSARAAIAVLSLGGTTFEVSLLAVGDGVVEVNAVGGDGRLGGDDWDQRVVDHLVRQAQAAGGVNLLADETALRRLREAAEQAKIELSSATQAQISLPYLGQSADGPLHLDATLTRAEFQAMTADLLGQCGKLIDQVVAEAEMGSGDIDHVVLSGGATRMPAFADLARRLAGGREPDRSVNPDEAVAAGAAWVAGTLTRTASAPLLMSATPWSLGVRTAGGFLTTMIYRNTTIPTKRSEIFAIAGGPRTSSDACVTIGVYQGERALAAENEFVDVLKLPLTPGQGQQIEVTIDIDADLVTHATAWDLPGGARQSVVLMGSPAHAAGDADPMVGEAELEAPGVPGDRTQEGASPDRQQTPDTGASSAEAAPVTGAQPSPEAARAAQEQNLGALRQAFTIPVRFVFKKDEELRVFEFEHGLVQEPAGSPPLTFRWDQIATVRQYSVVSYKSTGSYQWTSFTYTFTRGDGASVEIKGTFQDPARAPWRKQRALQRDPHHVTQRKYAELGQAAARRVAEAQLPAAQAALARGEEVTFGDIAISATGVRTARRDTVPWAEITEVTVQKGIVSIRRAGKFWPLSGQGVSKIPNFVLFMALAEALRKSSAG